jgi:hypothetical protein
MSWLFRGRKRRNQVAANLDEQTLDQLRRAGGDLSKSTEVINYLYLQMESSAREASAELIDAGYRLDVQQAATGSAWLALARIDMVPSPDNIRQMRARFESLASRLGGEYDGWEAAVTR